MATADVRPFVDEHGAQPVRGFLHRPARPLGDALVLAHGAGGNAAMPLLVALAGAFAERGVLVLRYDLPFRQAKRSGPPSPSFAARDQDGIRSAVAAVRRLQAGAARVLAGGQSYGGRQTTMVVAGAKDVADGVLALSYPLHPPGRPDRLRTDHFPDLRTPVLFVSGTKDGFGSIEELDAARKLIPARTQLVAIDGAGHGLLTKANKTELAGRIVQAFEEFLAVT